MEKTDKKINYFWLKVFLLSIVTISLAIPLSELIVFISFENKTELPYIYHIIIGTFLGIQSSVWMIKNY